MNPGTTAASGRPTRPSRRRRSVGIGTTAAIAGLLTLATPAAAPAATPVTDASAQASALTVTAAPAVDRNDLVWVRCPQGAGSIGIAPGLADDLRELLRAGADDGVPMCGGGWRSYRRQVELRFQNCGVSTKAVYAWPAKWCTPPTARPGTSMHERGEAVDFRPLRGVSRKDMYDWLRENAPDHGLYQLPSENWHYSTSGG